MVSDTSKRKTDESLNRHSVENDIGDMEGVSILKSSMAMTVGTLASRVTGLLRTLMMAYALGATVTASAYQVANTLPNMVYEIVAGGMISASFLPVLMLVMERDGAKSAWRYASNILNIMGLFLMCVSILGIAFAPQIVATQTFTDMNGEVAGLATTMFRVFSVQILLYGLSSVFQGIINANRSFLVTAIAPVANNVVVIIAFAAYSALVDTNGDIALAVLSVGTTLGVLVQVLMLVPAVRKSGFKWSPIVDLKSKDIIETAKIAGPTVLFVAASLVGNSCRTAFSLVPSDSGPAIVSYACLWAMLPYSLIAVSISRPMFTEMSDLIAKGDIRTFQIVVRDGAWVTGLIMVPMSACLIAASYPLACVFWSQAMSSENIEAIASLIRILAIGLPFYALMMYVYNAFAAMRKFMRFAALYAVATALQIALYAILTSSVAGFGLDGIGMADSAYWIVCAISSYILLMQTIESEKKSASTAESALRGDESVSKLRSYLRDTIIVFIASIASYGVILALSYILPQPTGMITGLIVAAIEGLTGIAVIGAVLIGSDSLGTRSAVKRIFKRSA